jgi:hypothetical protein
VADSTATGTRRSARDNDTLYRRPPAHPPAESTTGGSWFTGGTELPAEDSPEPVSSLEAEAEPPAEPRYGPATPAGSGRTSFGFTAGPISPARTSNGRNSSRTPSVFSSDSPTPSPPTDGFPSAGRPASAGGSPAVLPTRRKGPTETISPAAYEIAPISPNWPPPARLTPDQDTLDRVPGGVALHGPSGEFALRETPGEYAEWRTPSGEYPAAEQQARTTEDGTGQQRRMWKAENTSGQRRARTPDSTGEQRRAPRPVENTGEQRRAVRPVENTGEHRRVARREAPAEPLPPRQSRVVTVGMLVLTAIVLVAGTAVGIVYFSGSNETISSVLQLGAGGSTSRQVSAPLDNRTTASFEMLAGANTVHLTIGELGDDLYRISTPDDAGIKPSPEIVNDDVKLQVSKDGDGTGGEIEVVLSAKVRWSLRFSGYAQTQLIDVSGGQVSDIEMVAAMQRAELTLPQPSGTIPLKINGSVDELVVKSPLGSPVRIKVGGGADTVVAGTRTLKNVVAGSTLTPKDWKTGDRYDVTAGAHISSLTIENA